jgi:hypothetical protein
MSSQAKGYHGLPQEGGICQGRCAQLQPTPCTLPGEPSVGKSSVLEQDPQLDVETVTPIVSGTPIYDDSCPNQTVRQKFVTQGYKDWPFAIAFILQLIAVIGVAIYNGVHDKVRFNVDPSGRPYVEYIAGSFLAAIFLCFVAMVVMRFSPKGFIWAATGFSILIYLAFAAFLLTRDET